MKRAVKIVGWLLLALLVAIATGWCGLFISFQFPVASWSTAAAITFVAATLVAFAVLPNRRRTLAGFGVVFALMLVWWFSIQPSNDREWSPEYAKLPYSTRDGSLMTIHNVRNFEYRSPEDFDVRYYDRTYDLDQLRTMDVSYSHWGNEAIAHTILSFGFASGDYVAISVETRREEGEEWNSIGGLFKQYELTYIVADEADVLRLRTNFREETVYTYPIRMTGPEARRIFESAMATVNELREEPRFYNTLTHNCTTTLVPHFEAAGEVDLTCVEILLNGYGDQVAYEDGSIDTELSYEEAKQVHRVNQYVEDDPSPDDYSKRIRPFRYR